MSGAAQFAAQSNGATHAVQRSRLSWVTGPFLLTRSSITELPLDSANSPGTDENFRVERD